MPKMKNKITNESYGLVDNVEFGESPTAIYSIKIKDKKYKNVVVSYGKIALNVEEGEGTARLSFKYQVDDPAKFDRKDLENDDDFNTYLGDLLSHIIQTALDTGNYKVGSPTVKASEDTIDVHTTTNDDPSEADQR